MNAIPNFGIGTYTLLDDECFNIVSEGLKMGYKLIDTAELYNNHKQISQALKNVELNNNIKREDIWITSKIHNRDQRKLNIAPAIEKILKDLDTDYLDLILLHSSQKTYIEAYAELIRCQNRYNIKNIGVSNFRIDELEAIDKATNIKPYLNQIEISPFCQRSNLRKYMSDNNIRSQAYASLTCSESFDRKIFTDNNLDPVKSLLGWAKYYDLKPIPTAHNITHLIANYDTLSNYQIQTADLELLDQNQEIIIKYKQHMD